jgi:hypothetical protein
MDLKRQHFFASLGCLALLLSSIVTGPSLSQALGQEPPPSTAKLVEAQYVEDGITKTVLGELVSERPNFGHLILNADGELITIDRDELKSLVDSPGILEPTALKAIGEKLLLELPPGSKFFTTEHYVVGYNTTETYARWNAKLYEQRLKAFLKYWNAKGLKLQKPRFPLVALIFESQRDYVAYASKEFAGSERTFGYYHQGRNRLASYDLTGVEGVLPPGVKVNREELLNTLLSRPEAERTISTIIHEATHQMAFNCGLQTRLGDNPLWLSEGLATYFETPAGIGKLNTFTLSNLAQSFPMRDQDSLVNLLTNDSFLRNEATTLRGYGEAWGLFHYLAQSNPKGLAKYFDRIRSIPIGFQSNAKERLDIFRDCFGDDLEKLDQDFVKHIRKLRK